MFSRRRAKIPNAEEITRIGNECEDIVMGQISAWNTRNVDNLRQIYSDDIVHFDGEPAFTGIDEVVDMAKQVWDIFPKISVLEPGSIGELWG